MKTERIAVERLDPSQAKQLLSKWYIAERHANGVWLDPSLCRQFVTKKDALAVARGANEARRLQK